MRYFFCIVVFFSFVSCDQECKDIQIKSTSITLGGDNILLLSDYIDHTYVQDSFISFSGNNFDYNGKSGGTEERNVIVFPAQGKPSQSSSCDVLISDISTINVKLYYDDKSSTLAEGNTIDQMFLILNNILIDYKFGHQFVIEEKQEISEFIYLGGNPDLIHQSLQSLGAIDKNFDWHIYLIDEDNYLSLSDAAVHHKSNSEHLIIGTEFFITEPLILLHELLHGFTGHVDIEADEPIYDDGVRAIQNIMYNRDVPTNPKYSFYQNMAANGIKGSTYIGINELPITNGGLGLENLNESPPYSDYQVLTSQTFQDQKLKKGREDKSQVVGQDTSVKEEESKILPDNYLDAALVLASDNVETCITNIDHGILDHPDLIFDNESLIEYLEGGRYLNYNSYYQKALVEEANFLSQYGLENKIEYRANRLQKHLQFREKNILKWVYLNQIFSKNPASVKNTNIYRRNNIFMDRLGSLYNKPEGKNSSIVGSSKVRL